MNKLYKHETTGGAQYLMDTFIPWKHNGKSGKEGTINEKTRVLIRLDGKQPEIIHNTAEEERDELIKSLESMLNMLDPEKLQKMADASNYSVELFLFAREQAIKTIAKVKK